MPVDDWGTLERILAVRLDNVGDIVMTGPALRALKSCYPNAEVTLLASPAGTRAAALLPWVGRVITHRPIWQDASGSAALDPGGELDLVARLRGDRFDAAFIFTSFSQSPWPPAFACYLAGIPRRVGQARDFGGGLLTVRGTPPPDWVHQVDRNLNLVEAVGIPITSSRLEVHLSHEARARGDEALRRLGLEWDEPFMLVAPGASCSARRYPASRFARVVDLLVRRLRLPVLLTGSPRERRLLEAIREDAGVSSVHILEDEGIPDLAAVIARASLLVANNSGPMHLADAVGCPMVILYSGTDFEKQWGPRGARSLLLRRPTDCHPCYRFECPFNLECLDLSPAMVVEACDELLDIRARSSEPAGGPALSHSSCGSDRHSGAARR